MKLKTLKAETTFIMQTFNLTRKYIISVQEISRCMVCLSYRTHSSDTRVHTQITWRVFWVHPPKKPGKNLP